VTSGLYSPSWYRVCDLKPRLRAHTEIHRQRFRGDVWYLLQDHQTGHFHRLSPSAHLVLCMMDGHRTVSEIWERVGDKLEGAEQPTQEEIIRLLAQLHGADLLVGQLPPNMDELNERADKTAQRALLTRIRNPMALRFPLVDPDRFLGATLPLIKPLFSAAGFIGWLALVGTATVLAVMNAHALAGNLNDQILTAQNIALILLAYPFVKAFHELGHAYATKVWGGEIHEIGIMLLIFVPVPYVDASSSAAFRNKWQRATVSAAGILVEGAIASIALLVWLSVEPGFVRAFSYNVMLIGGISTLLFNGNPLLKFDGYYVLSDLVEIPNLGPRANKYITYLIQRYAFGIAGVASAATARGEAGWFFLYAVAATAYRLSIMLTIALYIAGKLFFVGILLSIASVATTVIWPLVRALRFVADSPQLYRRRRRAIVITLAAGAAAFALLLAIPLPFSTIAQGVVWVGDQAAVHALTDGFVAAVPVDSGNWVEPGTTLIRGEDSVLAESTKVVEKHLAELRLRLDAAQVKDLVQANILREQVRLTRSQLDLSRQHLADLDLKAAKAGRFLVSDQADLPGRFLHKGDTVGFVVGEEDPIVRVLVAQDDVDPVRRNMMTVEIRAADHMDRPLPATVLREVPSATAELPHLALATIGGGHVLLDPAKQDHPKPLESLFQFDLRVEGGGLDKSRLGGRVYVRFLHPPEPIAYRIARAVRQLFLRQLNV
jgi:putative peptide zinc metalloprotease protein